MDQRAQISVEYILMMGIVLLIVLVFATFSTDQSEQNNVAMAVQLGASNATSALEFANSSQSPLKVTNVNMSTGKLGSNITMMVNFSRPVTSQQTVILNGIQTSLASAGFTNSTNNGTAITLTTGRHLYIISLG